MQKEWVELWELFCTTPESWVDADWQPDWFPQARLALLEMHHNNHILRGRAREKLRMAQWEGVGLSEGLWLKIDRLRHYPILLLPILEFNRLLLHAGLILHRLDIAMCIEGAMIRMLIGHLGESAYRFALTRAPLFGHLKLCPHCAIPEFPNDARDAQGHSFDTSWMGRIRHSALALICASLREESSLLTYSESRSLLERRFPRQAFPAALFEPCPSCAFVPAEAGKILHKLLHQEIRPGWSACS